MYFSVLQQLKFLCAEYIVKCLSLSAAKHKMSVSQLVT